MSIIKYNCLLCLVFLASGIYLLLYFSSYGSDKCIVPEKTQADSSTNSNITSTSSTTTADTTANSTNTTATILRLLFDQNLILKCMVRKLQDTTDTTGTTDTSTTEEIKGTKYTLVPLFQALGYIACFVFGLLYVLGLNCFKDYEPDRFAKLGTIKGCFSVLVKLMPTIVALLHYIIFLLILIQYLLLNTENNCKDAQHENSDGTITTGDMYEQGKFINNVICFIWIFLHFLCPLYKATLPILPFSFAPTNYQATPVKRFLSFFGPL